MLIPVGNRGIETWCLRAGDGGRLVRQPRKYSPAPNPATRPLAKQAVSK